MSQQLRHHLTRAAMGALAITAIAAPTTGARPAAEPPAVDPGTPAPTVIHAPSELDLWSAGVGAAAMVIVALLVLAAASLLRRRRGGRRLAAVALVALAAGGFAVAQASAQTRTLKPDLVVSEYDPYSHVTVRNQGNGSAGASQLKVSTAKGIEYFNIPSLSPWSSYTIPVTRPCWKDGSHKAVADATNAVVESNETNNQRWAEHIC